MPLVKGKAAATAKGRSENIKRLIAEGKKQDQAVAIAMDLARKAKKGAK